MNISVSTRLSELPSKEHSPAVPIQPKPWKLLPKEATAISSHGLLLVLLVCCGKTLSDLSKDGPMLRAPEVLLLQKATRGVRSPAPAPLRRRALSNAERAAAAAAVCEPQGSSSCIPSPLLLQQVLSLSLIHEAGRISTAGAQLRG